MTAGDIYTVAGDATAGYAGDDRTGDLGRARRPPTPSPSTPTATWSSPTRPTTASGWWPRPPATFYGTAMTAGDIYTVAGDGTSGFTRATPAPPPRPSSTARRGGRRRQRQPRHRRHRQRPRSGWWPTPPAPSTARSMTASDIYTVAGDGIASTLGRRRPGHVGRAVQPGRCGHRQRRATSSSPTAATTGCGWWPPPPASTSACP